MFLPLPLFFVCVCVLIIRGLLARFPNPTLTFLSATEKRGIPPAGTQSKRPGENSNSVHESLGTRSVSNRQRGGCENYTAAGEQEALGSHVVHCRLPPILQMRVTVPEGSRDLTLGHSASIRAKQLNFFKTATTKHFSVQASILHKKHSHTQRIYNGNCVLQTHENFLITKQLKLQSADSSHAFIQRVFIM